MNAISSSTFVRMKCIIGTFEYTQWYCTGVAFWNLIKFIFSIFLYPLLGTIFIFLFWKFIMKF